MLSAAQFQHERGSLSLDDDTCHQVTWNVDHMVRSHGAQVAAESDMTELLLYMLPCTAFRPPHMYAFSTCSRISMIHVSNSNSMTSGHSHTKHEEGNSREKPGEAAIVKSMTNWVFQ